MFHTTSKGEGFACSTMRSLKAAHARPKQPSSGTSHSAKYGGSAVPREMWAHEAGTLTLRGEATRSRVAQLGTGKCEHWE